MSSILQQLRVTLERSTRQRRHDAHVQRRTILVDRDADVLIRIIEWIGGGNERVVTADDLHLRFFSENSEKVLAQSSQSDELIEVGLPAGSTIRRRSGTSLDTWEYRLTGTSVEADVAFRTLATGDHLLYLRRYVQNGISHTF